MHKTRKEAWQMPIEKKLEEIIYEAKRSNLARLFVEGREDMPIYRKIAEIANVPNLCVEPCFGRENVLKIYKRKAEFPNIKSLFFADQDMWIFTGVPTEYKEMFFTKGYSIENDLFTDGENWLNDFLASHELSYKEKIVENIVTWFAFEAERYIENPHIEMCLPITLLSTEVMAEKEPHFIPSFLEKRGFKEANATLLERIKENYTLYIRGKYLFQMLEKIFQERKKAKKEGATFTQKQLWEIFFTEGKRNQNTCIQRFITIIKQHYYA